MLPIYIYLSQTPAPLHLLLLLAFHHHLRSSKLSSSALTVLEGKQQTTGQTIFCILGVILEQVSLHSKPLCLWTGCLSRGH